MQMPKGGFIRAGDITFKSLRPSDAYMRRQTRPSLV